MSDIGINQVLAQMRAVTAEAGLEVSSTQQANAASNTDFSSLMSKYISEVNDAMQTSRELTTRFETGDPTASLPEVMVASQVASLQFQAMAEVRNKFLMAYQEVMSMQV